MHWPSFVVGFIVCSWYVLALQLWIVPWFVRRVLHRPAPWVRCQFQGHVYTIVGPRTADSTGIGCRYCGVEMRWSGSIAPRVLREAERILRESK